MDVTLDYLDLPKSAGEIILPPLRSPNTTYIPRSTYASRYSPRTGTPSTFRPNLPTQQTYVPSTRQLPLRSRGQLRNSADELPYTSRMEQPYTSSRMEQPYTSSRINQRPRFGGVTRAAQATQRETIDISEDDLLDILGALSPQDRAELLRNRPELAKYRELF